METSFVQVVKYVTGFIPELGPRGTVFTHGPVAEVAEKAPAGTVTALSRVAEVAEKMG